MSEQTFNLIILYIFFSMLWSLVDSLYGTYSKRGLRGKISFFVALPGLIILNFDVVLFGRKSYE